MSVKVGINGFGRIGRLFVRAVRRTGADVDIVGVNDVMDGATMRHLFKYDSVHGVYPGEVELRGRPSAHRRRRDPRHHGEGPGATAVEGARRRGRDRVHRHLHRTRRRRQAPRRRARRRSSSRRRPRAPTSPSSWASTTTPTTRSTEHVVSNASCTTNCLAPMAKVLHDEFGIERGFMTTIHAYTNDQGSSTSRTRTCAAPAPPPCRSSRPRPAPPRPSARCMPDLKGKLDGFSLRVPTPDGSMHRPRRRAEDAKSPSTRSTPP